MESKVNYTIVGMFVIILSALMIFLFFWISAMRTDKVYNTYLIYLNENVTGLSVQSPVRFNGVPVGYVDKIQLDPHNPQLVKLTLKVEAGTPVTVSTVATMQFQGITGIMYVGLKAKTMQAAPLEPLPGQKYPIIPAQPSFLVQLSEVLPEVTENVRKIGKSITKVLNQENQKAISESLQNISKFSKTLADNSENLDSIIKSLKTTMANASKATDDLPDVMKQLNSTMTDVKVTAKEFQGAAKSFQDTMRTGKYAVRSFSTQLMPTMQQTMTRINSITGNLQNLSTELTRNPSALVRGKVPAAPGPGE